MMLHTAIATLAQTTCAVERVCSTALDTGIGVQAPPTVQAAMTQFVVQSFMLRPRDDLKVFKPVIVFDTVDVMYQFIRQQIATNMSLHDEPVFWHISGLVGIGMVGDKDQNIASRCGDTATLPERVVISGAHARSARVRAVASGSSHNHIRLDRESLAAMFADTLYEIGARQIAAMSRAESAADRLRRWQREVLSAAFTNQIHTGGILSGHRSLSLRCRAGGCPKQRTGFPRPQANFTMIGGVA